MTEDTQSDKVVKKKKDYSIQNAKVWSINFSNSRFVKKSRIILPALKDRLGLNSMGVTLMLAVEYCQQEQIYNDFLAFVNTRRRGLENK